MIQKGRRITALFSWHTSKKGRQVRLEEEKGGIRVLTKRENEVMRTVYSFCKEGLCVVSPSDLLAALPQREKWTGERLEKVLNALAQDEYFHLLSSERQGEKMYVITLCAGGLAYPRYAQQSRRNLGLKIAWAVASAVIAFLVGWILRWIF